MHIYCSPPRFGRGSAQVKTIHGSNRGSDTISPWNISASRKGLGTTQRICNSIECTGVSRVSLKETSTVVLYFRSSMTGSAPTGAYAHCALTMDTTAAAPESRTWEHRVESLQGNNWGSDVKGLLTTCASHKRFDIAGQLRNSALRYMQTLHATGTIQLLPLLSNGLRTAELRHCMGTIGATLWCVYKPQARAMDWIAVVPEQLGSGLLSWNITRK
ncbi:BgTH12-04207 [Blumeria graminis f. sp. triticale]|uniref:BgTH12-04207 n=1 Tax=Blumeria graminis f. sp. triticale TaxID=1689686 RepID=A0A9W4CX00_BLUGR|nr:BgTH12-04207 [Blumeria graminis f. sp. triticale]